jgi:hypothetical protein
MASTIVVDHELSHETDRRYDHRRTRPYVHVQSSWRIR